MKIFDRINKDYWIKLVVSSFVFGVIFSWLILKEGGRIFLLNGKTFEGRSLPVQIIMVVLLVVFVTLLFLATLKILGLCIDLKTSLLVITFIVVFFFIIPFSPNVFTFDTFETNPCCVDPDSNYFYSIFHLVSRGSKLYVEAFEIKDPVFFYTNVIAYSVMGQKGPTILEFILSIMMIVSLGTIAYKLELHSFGTVALLIIFAYFSLSPPGYVLIHTYHQPISFFLLIISLTLFRRTPINGILCGALFALMVFSKLISILLLPSILFGVAIFDQPNVRFSLKRIMRNIRLFFAGSIFATITLFLVMIFRGEFSGFIMMNRIQYIYYQFPDLMPGLPNQTLLHFLKGAYGWLFILMITLEILFSLFVSINIFIKAFKDKDRYSASESDTKLMNVSLFAALTIVCVLGVSHFTHMWVHHLQPFGIAISIGIIPVFLYSWEKNKNQHIQINIFLVMVILLMLLPPFKTLQLMARTFNTKISRAFNNQPYFPQNNEINSIFSKLNDSMDRELNYAVLQHNHPGFISVILPDYMNFKCTFLAQYPIQTSRFDDFNNCLNGEDIDVIFKVSSGYTFDMPKLEVGISKALNNFDMVSQYGGYDIYIRSDDKIK